MTNKYRLLLIVSIFIFVGCKQHAVVKWPEIIELNPKIKDNSIKLHAEIVEASYDFIYAKDFFVYEDSVMIVLNKSNKDVYFVEFYNLNINQIINRFLTMGNGPGEMLNVLAHMRGNKLFVHDFAANQIVSIDVDSVLSDADYEIMQPIRFSNTVGSPFVTFYDENQLIMEYPFYFNNKELKIDNNAPRFVVTNFKDPISMDLSDHPYFTYNVSQGSLIPNPKTNRLIYISFYYPEIEIYDSLQPIKRIIGPDIIEPSYRIDGKEIIFNKTVPYSYVGYCSDEDFLYFSYVGDYFHKGIKLRDLKSWILKFDWDGNFIECYDSPQYIKCLSKSLEENVFYGRGFDEEGTVVLWKLTPQK